MIEADLILAKLYAAGIAADASTLRVEPRDGRTAVHLGGGRMAWFPQTEEGCAAMARERRVLRLIERYCSFRVPRVLHEDADGWEVRAITPGVVDPQRLYDRMAADPGYARAIGEALGRVLAEQHGDIPAHEIAGWLPTTTNWPPPQDLPNLPRVVDDPALLRRIGLALEAHAEACQTLGDPVLIHGDLGPHNFAVDPETGRVSGVFDYEGAAFGDRAQDFAYMTLLGGGVAEPDAMLDGALAVYQPLTGVTIDRTRVYLLNAVSAIGFLAHRHGHPPEEAWCGRTLAEDLRWTDAALAAAGFA